VPTQRALLLVSRRLSTRQRRGCENLRRHAAGRSLDGRDTDTGIGSGLRLPPPCSLPRLTATDAVCSREPTRILAWSSNDPKVTAGLVPDSHTFPDSRFPCRELHPFRENRALLIDGGRNGLIGSASIERFVGRSTGQRKQRLRVGNSDRPLPGCLQVPEALQWRCR
jgi:hypothetical protein